MVLKFLGRESGFGSYHTSAYFVTNNHELVIIDCSVSAFQKLKQFNFKDYKDIYVLITHTHSDHVGGLSLFVQYMYFNHHKEINIIAPAKNVKNDIRILLDIEGCAVTWYKLYQVSEIKKEWLFSSILTEHTPQLHGKCFGYLLNVNGTTILYSGDTCTLDSFELDILLAQELYIDVSVSCSPVHLNLVESLEKFLYYISNYNIRIYLMHLDNIELAEEIANSIDGLETVTVE